MPTPATSTDVTLTGTLSNVRHRHDGGLDATLTHPEAQAWVVFPARVAADNLLLCDRRHVTVHGNYTGASITAVTVEAARR